MAHHRGPAGQTDDRLCGTTVQKMSAMAAAASAADNDEEKKRHAWRELGLDDSSDDEASTIYDDHNGYRRLSSGREKRFPRRFVASPSKRGLSVEDIDSKVLADVDDSHDHEDEELDSSPLRKNKSSAVRSLIGHTSSITPGAISNKPRNTQDVLKSQLERGTRSMQFGGRILRDALNHLGIQAQSRLINKNLGIILSLLTMEMSWMTLLIISL